MLWILVKAKSHKESSGDKQEIYHYYDSQKIEVYRTKNQNRGFFSGKARKLEKIEELEHSMGVVPLTVLFDLKSDDGEFAGSSSLSDSCQLIIKLFNLNSWYDQLLYKTNYSTLAATPFHGSSDDMEIVIGAGDVLWVPEGCQMPQWIAPDTGPSEVFEKRISELRRRIYEMAELDPGFKENSRNVISGEAFSYQRKPVEEMALRLAGQLEEFENNIDRLILQCCARVNDPEPTVKYPNDYSQKSLADAISEIQTIEEVKSIPTKAREFLVSRILVSGRIAQLSEADGAYLKTIFENSEKRELMTSAEI